MALKSLSTRELRRELARREAGAARLQSQHAGLAKRLAQIEAELADLGIEGAPARRGAKPGRKPGRPKGSRNKTSGKVGRPKGRKSKAGGKRAKNAMTLTEAIMSGVRVGSTVSPAQAAVAAKQAGYKSSSPNFGMMVANALSKTKEFKRRGRGQYQRVGGKAPAAAAVKRAVNRAVNRAGKRAGRKAGKAAAKKATTKAPGKAAKKAAKPAARAAARPPVKPATKSAAKPAAKVATRIAAKPSKPTTKLKREAASSSKPAKSAPKSVAVTMPAAPAENAPAAIAT